MKNQWLLLIFIGLIIIGCSTERTTLSATPLIPPTIATTSTAPAPTTAKTPLATLAPAPTATLPPSTPTATIPIPTVTPLELPPGSTRLRSTDEMKMVYVPAGTFRMGDGQCGKYYIECEGPQHQVSLNAFWFDRTEVTVTMFQKFVQATGYQTTVEKKGWAGVINIHIPGWQQVTGANWRHPGGPDSTALDNNPVVLVSWDDAAAYCQWAGGRLPTEAEWEYAARGPNGLSYPWGNKFDGTRLNHCDQDCPFDDSDSPKVNDGYVEIAPVGSYPAGASWVGALDMSGNVAEWVNDWFDREYYSYSPSENPPGPRASDKKVVIICSPYMYENKFCGDKLVGDPIFDEMKVIRGGDSFTSEYKVRTTFRGKGYQNVSSSVVGFRCAASPDD